MVCGAFVTLGRRRCHFEDNTASDCGAAISLDNNPFRLTLRHITAVNNVADDGGVLCVDIVYRDPEDVGGVEDYYDPSVVDVIASVFDDNDADDDGGAIYAKAGTLTVTNVVSNNDDGVTGSFLALKEEASATVTNTIVTAADGDSVVYAEEAGAVSIRYSNFFGNGGDFDGVADPIGTDGNLSVDPQYTDGFRLDAGSPCVDAGDPSVFDTDGSRSDMGAYGGPEGDWP